MSEDLKFYGLLCFASIDGEDNDLAYAQPELHLNLWEIGEAPFLDVGLKIASTYPANALFFYFPWEKHDGAVEDLTDRLGDADAVSAVFNESWSATTLPKDSSVQVSDPRTGNTLFVISSPKDFWSVEAIGPFAFRLVIRFKDFIKKYKPAAETVYFRFRVHHVKQDFYSVGQNQKDRIFVSSWVRTEVIDMRVNVRRGAPPNLERTLGRYLEFSKVHFFLMRHRSHELSFHDGAFRSCRSLEDEQFWANYILPRGADDALRRETRARVSASLGYQWTNRQREGELPVHEFSILARFKRIIPSIPLFLAFVVVMGATGNALWDGLKRLLGLVW